MTRRIVRPAEDRILRAERADAPAATALLMGYTDVRKYAEGKDDWTQAGLAL